MKRSLKLKRNHTQFNVSFYETLYLPYPKNSRGGVGEYIPSMPSPSARNTNNNSPTTTTTTTSHIPASQDTSLLVPLLRQCWDQNPWRGILSASISRLFTACKIQPCLSMKSMLWAKLEMDPYKIACVYVYIYIYVCVWLHLLVCIYIYTYMVIYTHQCQNKRKQLAESCSGSRPLLNQYIRHKCSYTLIPNVIHKRGSKVSRTSPVGTGWIKIPYLVFQPWDRIFDHYAHGLLVFCSHLRYHKNTSLFQLVTAVLGQQPWGYI